MKRGYASCEDIDFDREELYESTEDREALMKMPETRREEILYERHLERQKLREKKELEEKMYRGSKKDDVSVKDKDGGKDVFTGEGGDEQEFLEFSGCIVSRDMIARNVFKPFFEGFVGHFTRARINGLYVVVKILGVSKGEVYGIWMKGQEVKTNRYLDVSTGTKTYTRFKIENVSNSPLLNEEYEDVWRSFKIGSVSKVKECYDELIKMMSKELSDGEITEMIKCKEEVCPRKRSVAHMKIELIQKRDKAIELKDKKTAMKYQKLIEEIEDQVSRDSIKRRE
ncbi:hypothetical protein CWI42_020540 [Ordospora colligata]|uniref:Plus3 domain-containing protein n=1 Tax=Ordospora colligata OC4 TaxID=1354746 RepID=A0A0B2ULT2_9MICR|nr:uncharacterized protein M896_020550 [Ordospora colligata OC4]KHN70219.1 hypothetical protein M896_020550 [Ordospora colligata OC4]TBU16763.1 hypothetical protein CWI41_020560 [Ordospora colligata]TBU17069.1 hypothetical protein CWI40_020560 [Ordospora colligata]TBU19312.1 hypothetical protein CWI42_020540 [Ordospora colligata]